jgi:hypothetical protein
MLATSDIGRTLPRRARVIRDHVAQYPDPIRVRAGQVVRLDREDDEYPGWWWCTAPDGRSGWVPDELLRRRGVEADILEDYDATELAVRGGDEVCVSSIRHEWLLVSNAAGAAGWIPATCVDFIDEGLNGTLDKDRT